MFTLRETTGGRSAPDEVVATRSRVKKSATMAASKICFVNKSLRDPVPDKVKIDKDKLMGFILAMCDELERCDVSKDGIRINPARGTTGG